MIPLLPFGSKTLRATTQAAGDSSTLIATDAFVTTAVNNAIAGVNPAVAVRVATAAVLPNSPTYNNGASGIGATLTTASTNVALVVDGVTVALGDRVLVKNQASAFQNGVYTVTQVAALGLAWILTRALDYNQPSDINDTGAIPVVSGTVNATTQWVLTSHVATVGTDSLTYTQFTLNPAVVMTTTTYDPAGIAQQVVGTTASQTVSGKILSDVFMGNTFESLSATQRSITLTASTKFEVDTLVEIGASYSLEIPATSSLEIEVSTPLPSLLSLANRLGSFVESGGLMSTSGTTILMGNGIFWINGVRVTAAASSAGTSSNNDYYVDYSLRLGWVISFVANSAASVPLAPDAIRIGIVTNNAGSMVVNQGSPTAITPVVSSNALTVSDSLGNLIYPTSPKSSLIGYRQVLANFGNNTNNNYVAVTGLDACNVIVPYAGARIMITADASLWTVGAGTPPGFYWALFEGSTQLAGDNAIQALANNQNAVAPVTYYGPATVGFHSYTVKVKCNQNSTLTIGASATDPMFIAVHLVL